MTVIKKGIEFLKIRNLYKHTTEKTYKPRLFKKERKNSFNMNFDHVMFAPSSTSVEESLVNLNCEFYSKNIRKYREQSHNYLYIRLAHDAIKQM